MLSISLCTPFPMELRRSLSRVTLADLNRVPAWCGRASARSSGPHADSRCTPLRERDLLHSGITLAARDAHSPANVQKL